MNVGKSFSACEETHKLSYWRDVIVANSVTRFIAHKDTADCIYDNTCR